MTRQVASSAAEAALALVLFASAIEKIRRWLKGTGPASSVLSAFSISSTKRTGLIVASMAADLVGVVMLVVWPVGGLAFTMFLIAIYTVVGVTALRRTGGGDCRCLWGSFDARSQEGLIARNLWLLGTGLVALALGPVAITSMAKEPEPWLILVALLGGLALSVRLGDGVHRRRQANVFRSSHQEYEQQPGSESARESADQQGHSQERCCQSGPMRGEPLPEGLRSRIENAGRVPPLVVGFVSEMCRGCRQLLAVLEEKPQLATSRRIVLVTPTSSTALWRAASDLGVEVIRDDGELWVECDVGEPPLLVAVGADGSVLDKALSPHIDRFATRMSIVEPDSMDRSK